VGPLAGALIAVGAIGTVGAFSEKLRIDKVLEAGPNEKGLYEYRGVEYTYEELNKQSLLKTAELGVSALLSGGVLALGNALKTGGKAALANADDAAKAGIKVNAAKGKTLEDATDVTGPKKIIDAPSGKVNYRVPDDYQLPKDFKDLGINTDTSVMMEVKNVQKQGLTSQIKDIMLKETEKNGGVFILRTNPETKLTKPLQKLVQEGKVIHDNRPF
jgi:hypothetical protein